MYVPKGGDIRETILKESHLAHYCAHPRVNKMYVDMKKLFFCLGMKSVVEDFVVKCLECQQVKTYHQHLASLLQPHDIPTSKWEVISLDLVVVKQLTKSSHFIPVGNTYDVMDVARVFINEIDNF